MDAYNSTVTEAEQGILSSIINNESASFNWLLQLKQNHFLDTRHQIIFYHLVGLFNKGIIQDNIILCNSLIQNGELEKAGGLDYIHTLTPTLLNISQFNQYCEIVKTAAFKRALIDSGEKMIAFGKDIHRNAELDIEEIKKDLTNLQFSNFDYSSLGDATTLSRSLLTAVEKRMQHNDSISGIHSGFNALDRYTGGLNPGEFTILAARPGVGKSAFLLSMLKNISINQNIPTAYFSLEMTSDSVMQRLFSIQSQIPAERLRNGYLMEEEYTHLSAKVDEIKNAPFFIIDEAGINLSRMNLLARNLVQTHGVKVIFVDYLQLIGGFNQNKKYYQAREQEIAEISRGLKKLARDLKVSVLVTSQLSRAPETRGGNKKPILSDLRDSGAIEQDADKVLFLYRGEYYGIPCDEDGQSTKNVAEIIIAKNRTGPLSTAKVRFIGRFYIFEDFGEFTNEENSTLEVHSDNEKRIFKRISSKMNDDFDEFLKAEKRISNKKKIFDKKEDFDETPPF